MSGPRRWTGAHPDGGRVDINGVTWWACDPYPTWFRWEGGNGDGLSGDRLVVNPDPDWPEEDELARGERKARAGEHGWCACGCGRWQ